MARDCSVALSRSRQSACLVVPELLAPMQRMRPESFAGQVRTSVEVRRSPDASIKE